MQGIACRDLKVDNVLVSNQHYVNISDKKLQAEIIKNEPIICKITDFGEARSQINQTKTLLATKTSNVDKGTLAYMALEIIGKSRRLSFANRLDLERIDVWALGLLFQCLFSPDTCPFTIEAGQQNICNNNIEDFINNMYILRKRPEITYKYIKQRLTTWSLLFVACELCTDFSPHRMPSANQILHFLQNDHEKCISLNLSQASALEKKVQNFAYAAASNIALPYHSVENDGSNSCSFLCLKL